MVREVDTVCGAKTRVVLANQLICRRNRVFAPHTVGRLRDEREPVERRDADPRRRPSRVGDVGDAGAGLGEGFEPVCFDASPELRERSSDQAEMERTDDGRVGRRSLVEGAVFEHDLLSARRSPKLGAEAVLLVETDDLVDRLLLRDRRKRWWPVDEVGAPGPSGLLGASAGVAL